AGCFWSRTRILWTEASTNSPACCRQAISRSWGVLESTLLFMRKTMTFPKNILAGFDDLATTSNIDLVCLSHLRWDFVYQRPQHLLSRFARERRVFFVEEPIFDDERMHLDVTTRDCGVHVVVPHLPKELS